MKIKNIKDINIGESFIVVDKNTHIIGDSYKYSSKGMNPHVESLMTENYIETFETGKSQFLKGIDRRFYSEDGKKYDNKTLLQKGLLTIDDGKKIDEFDNIVDMSELELFKKNPLEYPLKKIDIDNEDKEYLREKTYKEKFNDNLITEREYDAYITETREGLYSETDKMNNRLLNDKGLSETEKVELENNIATRKAEIKKENPKSDEL